MIPRWKIRNTCAYFTYQRQLYAYNWPILRVLVKCRKAIFDKMWCEPTYVYYFRFDHNSKCKQIFKTHIYSIDCSFVHTYFHLYLIEPCHKYRNIDSADSARNELWRIWTQPKRNGNAFNEINKKKRVEEVNVKLSSLENMNSRYLLLLFINGDIELPSFFFDN